MRWSSAVVRAGFLVGLEGVAVAAAAVGYAVVGAAGEAASRSGVVVGAVLLAAAGVGLLLVARGLVQGRRWARSPAVVVQLLVGLTALSLLQTLPVAAGLGIAVAGVALYQLATPEARLLLDRPVDPPQA